MIGIESKYHMLLKIDDGNEKKYMYQSIHTSTNWWWEWEETHVSVNIPLHIDDGNEKKHMYQLIHTSTNWWWEWEEPNVIKHH